MTQRLPLTVLLGLSLVLAACGESGDTGSQTQSAEAPTPASAAAPQQPATPPPAADTWVAPGLTAFVDQTVTRLSSVDGDAATAMAESLKGRLDELTARRHRAAPGDVAIAPGTSVFCASEAPQQVTALSQMLSTHAEGVDSALSACAQSCPALSCAAYASAVTALEGAGMHGATLGSRLARERRIDPAATAGTVQSLTETLAGLQTQTREALQSLAMATSTSEDGVPLQQTLTGLSETFGAAHAQAFTLAWSGGLTGTGSYDFAETLGDLKTGLSTLAAMVPADADMTAPETARLIGGQIVEIADALASAAITTETLAEAAQAQPAAAASCGTDGMTAPLVDAGTALRSYGGRLRQCAAQADCTPIKVEGLDGIAMTRMDLSALAAAAVASSEELETTSSALQDAACRQAP